MNQLAIFAIICLAVAAAYQYEIAEDDQGQHYYLVPIEPVHRVRRQAGTSINVDKSGPGTRVTLGHQGTILNNGVHRLDGGGFASKQFKPSGPATIGGNLGYTHIPSGSNLNVNAANTRGFGTDVGATGTANIWQRGNSRLDAVGSYQRHFGGAQGTGRPGYYGGLQFNHRF